MFAVQNSVNVLFKMTAISHAMVLGVVEFIDFFRINFCILSVLLLLMVSRISKKNFFFRWEKVPKSGWSLCSNFAKKMYGDLLENQYRHNFVSSSLILTFKLPNPTKLGSRNWFLMSKVWSHRSFMNESSAKLPWMLQFRATLPNSHSWTNNGILLLTSKINSSTPT